jgi:integrase
VRLGKREVDALACPAGRRDVLVFDDELPGFGLRVTAAGTKTFLYQYRVGPKVRRLVLGEFGTLTPAQARTLAERARAQARAGGDPAADRRDRARATVAAEAEARRRAEADALTFGRLAELWGAAGLRDRRESYRREVARALRLNFPHLALLPAHAVDAAAAVRALDAIAEGRGATMARRSHAYARAMYAWAVRRRMLAANPFAGIEAEGRDVPRDRVLTDAELGAAWRAAGRLGPPFGPCLRFLMLTLQRRDEVAGMCWDELAPDLSTWTIPAGRAKNGKAHIVHLSEPARATLRGLPRTDGVALVFTTTGRTPLSGFSGAKVRLDAEIAAERAEAAARGGAGEWAATGPMPPWRLHDLRRTGVTALAGLGVPPHVCDRLLNHAEGAIRGVAAIYQRHDFLAERAAALDAWARHVLRVADQGVAVADGVNKAEQQQFDRSG